MNRISSGIKSLDSLIDSFYVGDNVVWEVEAGTNYDLFIKNFVRQSFNDNNSLIYISFNRSPQSVLSNIKDYVDNEHFVLLDCFTSGKGKNDNKFLKFYENPPDFNIIRAENPSDVKNFNILLNSIEENFKSCIRYIFDSLTGMQDLWGNEENTYKFFTYICPRLFDMGTVAFWILEKDAHSQKFKANLRHITQVVIDLYKRREKLYIKTLKLEGRQDREAFKPHQYEIDGENIRITLPKKEGISDIGIAIRECRIRRGISQKELADKVDLTASFISQLENNQISPSLNSFIQICDALKISPSELLEKKKQIPLPWLIREKMVLSNEPVISDGVRAYKIKDSDHLSVKMLIFPHKTIIKRHFSERVSTEYIHIIQGSITVNMQGRKEQLLQGDSLFFRDNFPLEWLNDSGETVKLISVSYIE